MKALTVSVTLLAHGLASAASFKVIDPVIRSERVSVPIGNITCEKGPFRMSQLQVKLPNQVGSPERARILKSEFMGGLADDNCDATIANLLKFAHDGQVDLEATIEARSVVKLIDSGSYECEGAQQEVVSAALGDATVRESIFNSEGKLNCPDGLYPFHVRSRDNVIYVLHEDGIPTKSEY